MDGSFLYTNSVIGLGGLVRSSTGEWLAGFSSNDGQGDALLAEILAVRNGLTLAWNLGVRKVICESDSLDTVSILKSGENV